MLIHFSKISPRGGGGGGGQNGTKLRLLNTLMFSKKWAIFQKVLFGKMSHFPMFGSELKLKESCFQ